MGKLTISVTMFNSFLYVYQRVSESNHKHGRDIGDFWAHLKSDPWGNFRWSLVWPRMLLQNGPLQPLNRTVTTTRRRHNFSFSRRQQGSSLWDGQREKPHQPMGSGQGLVFFGVLWVQSMLRMDQYGSKDKKKTSGVSWNCRKIELKFGRSHSLCWNMLESRAHSILQLDMWHVWTVNMNSEYHTRGRWRPSTYKLLYHSTNKLDFFLPQTSTAIGIPSQLS